MAKKRKKQEEGPKGAAAWMATFSDLMNLLLCFFVLLFSMSSVDAEKFEQVIASLSNSFSIFDGGGSAIGDGQLISSGATQLNELGELFQDMGKASESENENDPLKEWEEKNEELTKKMYDEISEDIEKSTLDNYVEINYDENDFLYVQISLSGSILFDSGAAEIKSEALPLFDKIAIILKKYNDNMIEIEGHTDNIPISNGKYKDNNWLSSARALNVAEYLINNKGLDATSLKYSGRGEYEPIASNSTEEGRSKNRRVEIKIYNDLNS